MNNIEKLVIKFVNLYDNYDIYSINDYSPMDYNLIKIFELLEFQDVSVSTFTNAFIEELEEHEYAYCDMYLVIAHIYQQIKKCDLKTFNEKNKLINQIDYEDNSIFNDGSIEFKECLMKNIKH